jgi:hypothetical protein
MSMARHRHTAPVVAIGRGVLAAAIGLAIVPLVIANRAASAAFSDIPVAVIAVSFGFVGALVASRQPRNLTGWLFLFVALAIELGGIADEYAVYALLTHPGLLPGGVWAVWLTSCEQVLLFPAGAIAVDPGEGHRGDRLPAGAGTNTEVGQPAGVREAATPYCG